MKDIKLHELQAEVIRLKTELEDARIYADGLSNGLEKAQMDNRTLLEKLEKTEMELRSLRMKGE